MEKKINRNGKIKYVPKQAYNKFNILFTTFLSLIFFHEIWFSTCHKFILNQRNINSGMSS